MNALNSVKDFFCARGNAFLDIKPLKEGLFAIEDGLVKIGATALAILTLGRKERVNDLANLSSGAHKILTGPYLYVAKIINPYAVFTDTIRLRIDNKEANSSKKLKPSDERPIEERKIEDREIDERVLEERVLEEREIPEGENNEGIHLILEESYEEIVVVKAGIFTSKLTNSLLKKATDASNADNTWLSRNVFSRVLFGLTIPVAAISAIADVTFGAIAAVFSILPCFGRATSLNVFAYDQLSSITGLGISARGLRGLINPSQFQAVLQ